MTPTFKKVEVPVGKFIGWGPASGPSTPPQQVTLRVLNFDEVGGRDFNGNTCPQLVGTLTEPCTNYRDKGATKETIPGGELVTVTAGTANLRKGLLIANPSRDDVVRMTYDDTYKTANGDGKVITVEHAKAEGGSVGEDDL
jgi:hypothetical protein